MSDLNQLIRMFREGALSAEEAIPLLGAILEKRRVAGSGPVCCFYLGKAK